MKGLNIPPHITLIIGIVLVIIMRTVFNTESTIPGFIQLFGVVLVFIGLAGLIGRLFRKKKTHEPGNTGR